MDARKDHDPAEDRVKRLTEEMTPVGEPFGRDELDGLAVDRQRRAVESLREHDIGQRPRAVLLRPQPWAASFFSMLVLIAATVLDAASTFASGKASTIGFGPADFRLPAGPKLTAGLRFAHASFTFESAGAAAAERRVYRGMLGRHRSAIIARTNATGCTT